MFMWISVRKCLDGGIVTNKVGSGEAGSGTICRDLIPDLVRDLGLFFGSAADFIYN